MSISRFIFSILVLFSLSPFTCQQKAEKMEDEKSSDEHLAPDKIPEVILTNLKSRFPDAEIQKCTKEKEEGNIVYDIEFRQGEQKFEADIDETGTIMNWEKEIQEADLPEAVQATIREKYGNMTVLELMEVTSVVQGKDMLEGYEIVLKPAAMEEFEAMLAPDGTILDESEEEK